MRSSWFGISFASVGVACLIALASLVLVSTGVGWFSVGLAVAAAGALGVVLFDMPITVCIDAEGVVRRTPLREHRIAWDDIDRLQRMRRASFIPKVASKGLVAMRGPRQVLLCDRTETRREHEQIRTVMGPELADLFLTGLRNPESS